MTQLQASRPVNVHPYFLRASIKHAHATNAGPWNVLDLCKAYHWPTGLSSNAKIAIVELGGGWTAADMAVFFKKYGIATPTITDVSVDGTKNTPGQDADGEVALDIQLAAAAFFAATGKAANIAVYWAQDIATAVRKAAKDGCDVCSISWGADEADWGTAAASDMEQAAIEAVSAGMVVFAASGDNDSSDGGSSAANVDLPASAPHIIGCGGTFKSASAETVWNNNPGQSSGEGTGGGYSTMFPAQSWQKGAPPAPGAKLGRLVPDVAADADPNSGYEIYFQGAWQVVGGTSAVAPLYAGLFAALGTKLGYILPKLWASVGCFTDIVSGDNGTYKAAVGPDACTGLGSPIGTALAALFVAAQPVPAPLPPVPAPVPTPPSPTPTPTPVPPAPPTPTPSGVTLAGATAAVVAAIAHQPHTLSHAEAERIATEALAHYWKQHTNG